jgi:hypothetical protein
MLDIFKGIMIYARPSCFAERKVGESVDGLPDVCVSTSYMGTSS